MSTLHDPSSGSSIESTPTASTSTAPPTIQSEAIRLTSLKDNINARLEVYYDVLKTNNCTTSTPLVDPQGFPRADIDVAGVRTARVQIIRLKNDLKDVMKEMGELLERGLPRAEEGEAMEEDETVVEEGKTPFAKIDGVFPGGPASLAGLQRGDQLVSLGSVNVTNHDHLKNLAALVNRSEGAVLPVVVLRPSATDDSNATLNLSLIPKTGWGGRGLLGCHVVPV